MKYRMSVSIVVALALLLVLAFAVAACGSSSETTTTAAPATTTTAAAATTTTAAAATGTTVSGSDTTASTAGSVTVPSITMTPELTAYLAQMQSLFGSFAAMPDEADPFSVTDISQVTDAQIQAAEAALAQIKTAVEGLKKLQPPAELKAFQDTLVSAIESELSIGAKAIQALKDKDATALAAAKAESDKLDAQMSSMIEQLAPLIMGTMTTAQ